MAYRSEVLSRTTPITAEPPRVLARRLLSALVRGHGDSQPLEEEMIRRAWSGSPQEQPAAAAALFSIVAEHLSDTFTLEATAVYVRLFSRILAAGDPHLAAEAMIERSARVRSPRPVLFSPERVVVLSRVTLGADIAVTSQFLRAARNKFPSAQVLFAGAGKNFELFAGDPLIGHLPVRYPRRQSTLQDRLDCATTLANEIDDDRTLVLDPDSRITQLGLLPMCEDSRYRYFDSRSTGAPTDSLYKVAQQWLEQTLGIPAALPFVAPATEESIPTLDRDTIAVSLGVGDNLNKRLPDPFEQLLLTHLAELGPLIVDCGAGGEERRRVEDAVAALGAAARARVTLWNGSFAGFVRLIQSSRLYVGYDSAGQHAAAVSGIPAVIVFSGFLTERTLARWTPISRAPLEIIRADRGAADQVLDKAANAARQLFRSE